MNTYVMALAHTKATMRLARFKPFPGLAYLFTGFPLWYIARAVKEAIQFPIITILLSPSRCKWVRFLGRRCNYCNYSSFLFKQ